MFAPKTRFIPDTVLELFERRTWPQATPRIDVAQRMRDTWR
jgi:hypothetical protein